MLLSLSSSAGEESFVDSMFIMKVGWSLRAFPITATLPIVKDSTEDDGSQGHSWLPDLFYGKLMGAGACVGFFLDCPILRSHMPDIRPSTLRPTLTFSALPWHWVAVVAKQQLICSSAWLVSRCRRQDQHHNSYQRLPAVRCPRGWNVNSAAY